MGLLRSINNVPDIDYYEYRDIEYFGAYKYRARMKIVGANLMWFNKKAISVHDINWKYEKNTQRKQDIINNLPVINNLIKWTVDLKKSKTITTRIESDTLAIFANDLSLLTQLKSIHNDVNITEAITSEYAGIKYFVREPKHKYRIYFKSLRIDHKTRNDIAEIIDKNKNLYPSKALNEWINPSTDTRNNWRHKWLSASYSLEYDDESMLSYLLLMHSELFGKKYKLEKHPED